jgi:hypothetical protein
MWWDAARRVAIAAQTRHAPHCALCRRRKEALSPATIEGKHDSLDELPETVIEVIHRVRSDPGRLSERWFRDVVATGLREEEYVETVSIVAMLLRLTRWHAAWDSSRCPNDDTSGGSLTQASLARSVQLKNPGLFRCLFQGLPTGGHPRHKGLAPLALQNRFACGIVRVDGDEGLSDLLDQHRIQVAVGRETAVTGLDQTIRKPPGASFASACKASMDRPLTAPASYSNRPTRSTTSLSSERASPWRSS